MKKQSASKIVASNVRALLATHQTIKTQTLLAKKSGLGQSSISRILRVDTAATAETIAALATAFGITAADLMTPNFGLAKIETVAMDTCKIPVINYLQAGRWPEESVKLVKEQAITEWVSIDLNVSDKAFGLEIKDESMLPDFTLGDRIIVDPKVSAQPGDFVVAKDDKHSVMFRKYRPRGVNEKGTEIFELVPLNDDFPSMYSHIIDLHLIGTMVEHRKYRMNRL